MYCTVLFCTVMYYTALHCTVMYCTGLYCTVLYWFILFCTLMQSIICSALDVPYCTELYYIKIRKTTFDFDFDLYKLLNSMDTQKHGNKEMLSIK